MAVFKDLMDALFNEEVDDDEEFDEAEYEELDVATFDEKPAARSEEAPMIIEDQFLHPTPTPISADSSFMDISFDDDEPKAKKAKKKKAQKVVRMQQDTADYTPIISPIFGNTEESKKEFDKVHNAIELKKPLEEEAFTNIISPMFGRDLPKAKRVIPTMNVETEFSLDEMLAKKNKK